MAQQATAIILGRAGSKGLPRKNTLAVAGRPCVAWTIEAARRARLVGRVIVSTDDEDIKRLARLEGAEVHDRTPATAADTATVDSAAREALAALAPDAAPSSPIVLLYANVPVRPDNLIDRAVDLLIRSGCDSVQSYAPVGRHHPWWTVRIDEASGGVAPWEGDVLNHGVFRRQDLPPAYLPDGGVIALSVRALLLQVPGAAPGPHAFFGVDRRAVLTREGDVIDIDSAVDRAVAEATLLSRLSGSARPEERTP